ncbi:TetR/AcrR family transcriptional regulator [Dactylosporangium sp. NBC_01737]|uniref:TetR/AcrR family transcriptional regulator n=1 Tax=Dactylosporangium sp. NBC_01737 TaxID=2975959 RepID=UPI002E117F85|nr:TetR/AcrR family transcriptional regulator [Dactylosporangium sp. NBC_01737]
MTTRRYEQRRRAATAEETRRRILDAMYAQLPAMPSVDAVARQAGVARSTIYLVFGSRGGLFDALAQDVLDRGGYADLLVAVRATDPREHLRGGITATARMYAAQRDALAALHALAASTDGAVRRAGEARLGGLRHLVDRLHDAGLLRVPHTTAVDTLWLLTAFETFDTLYTGRGLPTDTVADHLNTLAASTLLIAPPTTG